MYSSVNNHDKSKSILSLGELLGIISVFAFVLYLLFPKGNIEEFLETQGHNNNLSIHYLKSMILYHPDNIELKMILMKKYTQSGKEKEALALNRKLIKNTSNKERLISLKKIEYLLEKKLYFQNSSQEKLKNLKEKLLAYYALTTDKRDYLFFFAESNNIDYNNLKYNSLQHLMEETPEIVNYELVKMAYDLASTLGYKDEAYAYLQNLINYPQISKTLSEHLIYSLFEHGEFKKAKQITTQLFLKSQTDDERTKYFHLALHALVQDRTKSKIEVSQLIQEYANVKALLAPDISIILNTLLELGDSKEAANFAINMFYSHPENFDETGIDLALQSLLYNAELEQARALSFFAQSKFKKQKYLDKTIQITAWLGETEAVSALNKEGYLTYKDKKYEKYFLDNENLDDNYEILGQIYQKKIGQAKYTFLDNLADYYDYTGEVAQAERYFTQVHTKNKHKKATYYAIEFSYKNSHFEKGLELYKFYLKKYGKDSKLHELSIKKLLALKRFEEAYAMSKTLDEPAFLANKQTFTDLAWMEKDYAYLHQKFWDFEKKKKLENHNFEQFILLEKALNQGKQLNYLYLQAWERTDNPYHLSSLFYKLLQEKKLNEFNNLLSSLSNKEQNIIHKNIDFQTLLAEYYVQNSDIEMAVKSYDKIFKLDPNKITSHQSYLWFLIDNQAQYPTLTKKIMSHLNKLQNNPALREKIGLPLVVGAMNLEQHKRAKYWLQEFIKSDPHNKEYQSLKKEINTFKREKLYAKYDEIINKQYLKSHINLSKKHLGSQLNVHETRFIYHAKAYKNIQSKVSLTDYRYEDKRQKKSKQTAFEIALKNTQKKFLWEINLEYLNANDDFLLASSNLSYNLHPFKINLHAKYQNKTKLTPQLEKNGLENSLALSLQTEMNQHTNFSFLVQERQFKALDGLNLGTAKQLRLNADYLLRFGYPDLSFNAYLSHNQFSKNIAQDFSEFGIASSIGTTRQHTLNSSWKPFGTVTLAINDEQNLGGSLTFGVSKMLTGEDSLDLLFDYYNGIGVISEPIYGVNIKYRF